MKEIWFWMSKDLAEVGITAIIMLVAAGCFGLWFLIDKIKKKISR